jgi:hypothetical protein
VCGYTFSKATIAEAGTFHRNPRFFICTKSMRPEVVLRSINDRFGIILELPDIKIQPMKTTIAGNFCINLLLILFFFLLFFSVTA